MRVSSVKQNLKVYPVKGEGRKERNVPPGSDPRLGVHIQRAAPVAMLLRAGR